MSKELWSTVDGYLADAMIPADPVLDAALADSRAAGLPSIAVAPNQGKLLNLLARGVRARSILEIGTLGGYSTIWLARALPEGGKLVTCEFEPKHAEVARANLRRAGFGEEVVEIRVGAALDTLPRLTGPFDFVFIDADKPNLAGYLAEAVRLSRPGTMVVVDNVVRRGTVADPGTTDPAALGVRAMNELISREPRIDATTLQTVGAKGHDGLTVALVT
ncbi:O-methyltransferase [Amycolatopsis samaneae]|uniref:O-methyltransferase n=1 Tax=Amycolatopsis samaneae TaxID=664691 RepID=A0ABW5G9Y1_9PSEU